jgi:hypothetical protein
MEKYQHAFGRLLAAAAFVGGAVVAAPSFGFTITVNGSGATATACSVTSVDGQGNITINCTTGSSTTCSVTPASQTIGSSGGTISLTASNCGTGSWTSSRSGASGGTGMSYSDTIPSSTTGGTYTYTFTGTGGIDNATVTQLAPPPPGGGGESISCSSIPGISNTIVIPVSWQTTIGTGFSTSKAGGFAPGTASVFAVQVPAGVSSNGKQGSFRISPSNAFGYNTRILSVSDSPCDYSGSLGTASVVQGQDVRVYFTVGPPPPTVDKYGRTTVPTIANLTPGKKYYFTVVNQYSVGGANSCTSSACDINYGLTPGT